MPHPIRFLAFALSLLLAIPVGAGAQCAPDCTVTGGGDATSDCHSVLASTALRLNSPFFNPAKPKPAKEIRCFDGDPACDLDGTANNACVFPVDVCLYNSHPALPGCTASDVTAYSVKGNTSKLPGLAGLQAAVDALLPATSGVCTSGQTVTVALKGPSSKGEFKPAKFQFKTIATTASGIDKDGVRFVCMPRGWPSHGYDNANTRASSAEVAIDSTNVSTLEQKWRFNVPGTGSKAVTSTVTVGPKMVYTTSWNGRVYALDKKTGKVKWQFSTGTGSVLGVQSSATLTADGRLVVGDSLGRLYCLDAKKGTLLWQADAAALHDPVAAHYWSSPTVADGRVVIGVASHNDAPCTRGKLFAFDLDTGAELWNTATVPERVCYDDTGVECSANADCAGELDGSPCLIGHCDSNPEISCTESAQCPAIFLTPGTCVTGGECWLDRGVSCTADTDCPACVPGKGGGITATAAASDDGKDIYMASVGCLSFPSIGGSDSIFKLDAATGAVDWSFRSRPHEQFKSFPGSPGYQDYGFLNGPILANVDDGMSGTTAVAVGGGKDGTLYAVDRDTGLLAWSFEVAPPPDFAGFGLFNGSLAYDSETDQFFAALFDIDTYPSGSHRLVAFNGVDGSIAWSDQIGSSWSSVTVAGDILYAGTQANSNFYAYDKVTGARLHTFVAPGGTVTGGAAVEGNVLYVPFGAIFGSPNTPSGVLALQLPAAP